MPTTPTFEAELLPHFDRVKRFAFRLTRDRAAAEDLAQQAMLKAFEAFDRYRSEGTARAWLLTMVLNEFRNAHRARKRSSPAEALVHESPEELPSEEAVRTAIEALPPRFREVMQLRELERRSYKEIAEALMLPIGTVMSRLHRARAQVRARLRAS